MFMVLGIIFSRLGCDVVSCLRKKVDSLDNLDEYKIYRKPYLSVLSSNKIRFWTREEWALMNRYNIKRISTAKLQKLVDLKQE